MLAESLGDGHRHGHDQGGYLHPLQYAAVPDSGSGGHAQPQTAPGAGGGHLHPLDLSLSLGTGSPVYESMMRRGHGHGSDEQKQYRGVTRYPRPSPVSTHTTAVVRSLRCCRRSITS